MRSFFHALISKKEMWKSVIGYLLLFSALGIFIFTYSSIGENILDSDMSSELVLGKLLSKENTIISKNWNYSTEIRVFDSAIVYAFLFKFIKSWRMVRLIGNLLCLISIFLVSYFICKLLKMKEYFPYVAFALTLPISRDYYKFYLIGNFYLLKMTMILLVVLLVIKIYQEEKQNDKKISWKTIGLLVGVLVLGFISGIGTLRYFIAIYLPLLLAIVMMIAIDAMKEKKVDAVFNKKNLRLLLAIVVAFLGAGIGVLYSHKVVYIENPVLSWDAFISWGAFSFDRLGKVINQWLECLGYKSGNLIISMDLLKNFVCFAFLFCIFVSLRWFRNHYFELEKEVKLFVLFYINSIIVLSCFYLFSTMDFVEGEHKYYILTNFLSFFIVFIFISHCQMHQLLKHSLLALVAIMVMISGVCEYVLIHQSYQSSSQKDLSYYLVENGLVDGYATFWNASVLSELSDGVVKMRVFSSPKDIVEENYYQWLQEKEIQRKTPLGKTFVVLSYGEQEELRNSRLISQAMEKHLQDEVAGCYIYVFDNYQQMVSCFRS